MTAVFTPMTSPALLSSGPPELPGFKAASVWMMSSINRPGLGAHGAAERADDAGGDGLLKAIGRADGNRDLPDADARGIRQPGVLQVGSIDADHGEIRLGIGADQLGRDRRGRRAA